MLESIFTGVAFALFFIFMARKIKSSREEFDRAEIVNNSETEQCKKNGNMEYDHDNSKSFYIGIILVSAGVSILLFSLMTKFTVTTGDLTVSNKSTNNNENYSILSAKELDFLENSSDAKVVLNKEQWSLVKNKLVEKISSVRTKAPESGDYFFCENSEFNAIKLKNNGDDPRFIGYRLLLLNIDAERKISCKK